MQIRPYTGSGSQKTQEERQLLPLIIIVIAGQEVRTQTPWRLPRTL